MYKVITPRPRAYEWVRIVFTSAPQFEAMVNRLERLDIPFDVSESEQKVERSREEAAKARKLAQEFERMYQDLH